SMQVALDSAALMLAKNPSISTMNDSQLLTAATGYFNALYKDSGATPTLLSASYNSSTSSIAVTANAAVGTNFLSVFRIRNLNVTTSATVTWGMSNLQVALALDNTGSMADYNKLTNLKTAAHQLLGQLQAAATGGSTVQVAIIPFATDVNIGTA